MRTCRVLLEKDGSTLLDVVEVAFTGKERMIGLMGRKELPPGEGLLIPDCRSVHTFFMRFPIDLAYLDGESRVVRIVPKVQPWAFSACWQAQSVLEMPAEWAEKSGLRVGDRLRFEDRAER
jgi:uncharacterized membrane protein (UPF0127 family)